MYIKFVKHVLIMFGPLGSFFFFLHIILEEQLYSLEQYIGCIWRLAFIHYCGLHQVWLEAEN